MDSLLLQVAPCLAPTALPINLNSRLQADHVLACSRFTVVAEHSGVPVFDVIDSCPLGPAQSRVPLLLPGHGRRLQPTRFNAFVLGLVASLPRSSATLVIPLSSPLRRSDRLLRPAVCSDFSPFGLGLYELRSRPVPLGASFPPSPECRLSAFDGSPPLCLIGVYGPCSSSASCVWRLMALGILLRKETLDATTPSTTA